MTISGVVKCWNYSFEWKYCCRFVPIQGVSDSEASNNLLKFFVFITGKLVL